MAADSRDGKSLDALFLGADDFDDAALESLLSLVDTVDSASTSRQRLLDDAGYGNRLDRYKGVLSKVLDVEESKAAELLTGVDNTLQWGTEPGLDRLKTVWVDGGPSVQNCIRGFVRLEAGASFPHHGHLGRETVIILQGHMVVDDGTVLYPGDVGSVEPGVEHSFSAMAGGPDLLYFVVAHEGIHIGDVEIRHRDGD